MVKHQIILCLANNSVSVFSLLLLWIVIVLSIWSNKGNISNNVGNCPYECTIKATASHQGICCCGSLIPCYCTPSVAIDAIIELWNNVTLNIVLVRRRDPPRKYAIPGGFVDVGESAEEAAIREVYEETKLRVISLEQFRVYSNPFRDSRRHTVSIVFRCVVSPHVEAKAGDDAKSIEFVQLSRISTLDLGFDHKEILQDYINLYHPIAPNPT